MANWDRQYRLRAGVEGSKGFEIGKPDEKTRQAIHINFMVERSDSTTLNTTKIKLWNLNKEQIKRVNAVGLSIKSVGWVRRVKTYHIQGVRYLTCRNRSMERIGL